MDSKEEQQRYDATRKLAAIMFADIVGYSKMMHADESAAFVSLSHFQKVLTEEVEKSGGHTVKSYGDGSLCLFPSAVQALRCAHAIQMRLRQSSIVAIRIGLHIGDVVEKDGDLYGDGVNIAARLESLGSAGTVFFSRNIYDKVHNHKEFEIASLGQFQLKNINEPIGVYSLKNEGYPIVEAKDLASKMGEPLKTAKPKRSFNILLYALLVLVLLGVGYVVKNSLTNKVIDKSIAILPFHNESADPENDYFCNGMMEDILTHIQNIGDLKVISRSSVMPYKNTPKPTRDVARELSVAYILEGSVRKSDEKVLVTARLINGEDESQIWAEQFNEELSAKNLFDIQGAIAKSIASNLKAEITDETKTSFEEIPTDNLEAYDNYLRGMYFYNDRFGRGEEYINKAISMFQNAIELDSNFARAHNRLGYCHDHIYWLNIDGSKERAELAKFHFNKAFQLDPNDPDIIEGQGWYEYHGNSNFTKAREIFKSLTEQFPKLSSPLNALGVINGRLGNWEESEENFEKSIGLDPSYVSTYLNYALNLQGQRKLDQAKKYYGNLLNISPQNARAHKEMSMLLIADGGSAEQALEYFRNSGVADSDHERKLLMLSMSYDELLSAQPANLNDLSISILSDYALINYYIQNKSKAKEFSDFAIEKLEAYTIKAPKDLMEASNLGKMYAISGMSDKAMNIINEISSKMALRVDALYNPQIELEQAKIWNIIGQEDKAINILNNLLKIPCSLTVDLLKTDPVWFNLRLNSRFNELLEIKVDTLSVTG